MQGARNLDLLCSVKILVFDAECPNLACSIALLFEDNYRGSGAQPVNTLSDLMCSILYVSSGPSSGWPQPQNKWW